MNDTTLSAHSSLPDNRGFGASTNQGLNFRETLIVVLIGGIGIGLMSTKAFTAYFFGENFIYLQFYLDHGSNFWRTFFSPFYGIFYRPIGFALDLPWLLILPPEPLAFHLRNFGLILLELFLLHRILCRVATSPTARFFGCIFFVLSKTHLTLIGYIDLMDSHALSLFSLLSVLYFLRYTQERKTTDYWLGLTFCLLSHGSKDYGLVINAVLVAIILVYGVKWQEWTCELRWWTWRILPLGFITVGYLCVRFSILGSIIQNVANSNTNYSAHFLFTDILGKILRFATTLCNASWVDDGSSGSSGLSTWLATRLQTPDVTSLTLGYCLFCGTLFSVLLWKGRKAGPKLLFPLLWSAAYLGPTLFVQNVNIYYHWEPMMGVAVLLTLLADAAGPKVSFIIGLPLLALIGTSGYLSNRAPNYHWYFTAGRNQALEAAVVVPYRHVPLKSITFVANANQLPFWRFSLADPMLQKLTQQPNLQIRYSTYSDVAAHRTIADDANLILDAEQGFSALTPDSPALTNLATISGPPVLLSVTPDATFRGHPFNPQPNSQSAISITCKNATPQSRIIWNGAPLLTAYGHSEWLTALVPKELYAVPGQFEISIVTDGVSSNKIVFSVRP